MEANKCDLEFKIVPFSKTTIRTNRLHLVEKDFLGGSTIPMLINNEISAQMPKRMATCYLDGRPIGLAIVFVIKPSNDLLWQYDETHAHELHGLLNVFVKGKYRCRGIGKKLMARSDFHYSYPEIRRVIIGSGAKGIYLPDHRIETIIAESNRTRHSSFIKRLEGKLARTERV